MRVYHVNCHDQEQKLNEYFVGIRTFNYINLGNHCFQCLLLLSHKVTFDILPTSETNEHEFLVSD